MSPSAHPLAHLGWDSAHEVAMAPHAATGAIAGRVVRVDRGLVSVLTATATLRVPVARRLLDTPPEGGLTAGDWVCIASGQRRHRPAHRRQDGRARAEARRVIKRRNRALRRQQPR